MNKLKSSQDIQQIHRSAKLLSETLSVLREFVRPGITTDQLNELAIDYLTAQGAQPAFLGYMDFPAGLCTSINEEIIHGIPGESQLREGDIISLDLGVEINGYYADGAITVPVGIVSEELDNLLNATSECLRSGIEQAVAGNRIQDISQAIYHHAIKSGYGVVREYCGHGVGFAIHEEPQIPNYPSNNENRRLKPGMVLAIEPMLTLGSEQISVRRDGWTVVTSDGLASAHCEHTIAILNDHTEILTI